MTAKSENIETLDIVNLIEKYPIESLSQDYQNVLLEKIKTSFTEKEQHMFVASFYCYLNCSKTDFLIDFDNVWRWVGFSRKDHAKTLMLKHFVENLDYKICSPQSRGITKGRIAEQILMTVETFKKFCIKADTKKASEIHDYYIKLENILHQTIHDQLEEFSNTIIKRDTDILQKNKQIEIQNKKLLEKDKELEIKNINHKKDLEIERHKTLIQKYGKSSIPLVYLTKIHEYENNTYAVKIGESRRGIEDRGAEHKLKYDMCIFLDCFPVARSKDFETFIHDQLKQHKVTNLKGHEKEKELFLIGDKLTLTMITNLIQSNIKNFSDSNDDSKIELLKLENENLRLTIEASKLPKNETLQNKEIFDKIDTLEQSNHALQKTIAELVESIKTLQIKNTTGFGEPLANLGPRLQQINPENLKLVKTFDSVTECIKENPKLKRSSINKAVKDNTIYHEYRWVFVDRELDPSKVAEIQPTKETKKSIPLGYIAKLDSKKSQILNVYLDRKTAAKDNGYPSDSSLDNPVKKQTLTNGNYYMLYNDCSNELKDAFVKKNKGKPILYKNGIGQYDSKGKLISEFVCKYDCARALKIGDKTLNKCLENNTQYNGTAFKYLDKKIKC
jgi:phage anti-repressor protein